MRFKKLYESQNYESYIPCKNQTNFNFDCDDCIDVNDVSLDDFDDDVDNNNNIKHI